MKEHTIHLTDRPAVRIVEDDWPVVARTFWPEDKREAAASHVRAWVRVRQHADGRKIVYGLRSEGGQEQRVGFLVAAAETQALVKAVHDTCALVQLDPQPVFDDLPPEEL